MAERRELGFNRNFIELPSKNTRLTQGALPPQELARKYGPTAALVMNLEHELWANGIVPKYDASSDRSELAEQGGILFANHPSKKDVQLVLPSLVRDDKIRDDFFILVSQEGYPRWVRDYTDKHFIKAPRIVKAEGASPEDHGNRLDAIGEASKTMAEIINRINEGQLFIFFPSYESEREGSGDRIIFDNYLMHLLKKLDSKTMAYTLGINPDAARRIESGKYNFGHTLEVPISQHSSTVGNWQEIAQDAGDSKEDQARAVTNTFVQMHELNYKVK